MGIDYTDYTGKDVAKDVILTALAGFGFLVYWVAFLFLISIILVNIWFVTWVQLVIYGAVLAVITEIFYIIHLVRKRRHEKEMRDYIHS